MSEEPAVTAALVSPAVLVAVVLLFVHAAASALLTVVVTTAAAGSGPPGEVRGVVVWVLAVAIAAGAVRPILRRVQRPTVVGVFAGLLAAGGYAALVAGLSAPGAQTPAMILRMVSMVLAGALVGVLARGRGAPTA